MFSRSQSSQPAAALMGRQLYFDPGLSQFNNRPLVGVADNLSATERGNAIGKRCGLFENVDGVNVSTNVQCGSGRLFDTTRDVDWFEANVAAEEFLALVRNEKVPYNIIGKGIIRAAFGKIAALAESRGVFEAGSTVFVAPKDGADDPADKAASKLKHTYSAKKSVGIALIDVAGTVSF
jgi:hypothetical protein